MADTAEWAAAEGGAADGMTDGRVAFVDAGGALFGCVAWSLYRESSSMSSRLVPSPEGHALGDGAAAAGGAGSDEAAAAAAPDEVAAAAAAGDGVACSVSNRSA